MCSLDAVAVGKHDKDAVRYGLGVGAWAVHVEEVRGTAKVGDSCVFGARRDGQGRTTELRQSGVLVELFFIV
jgi:hypothetical protein